MNVRNIKAETKEPVQVTTHSILESRVVFCLERSENIQSRLGKICGPDEIAYLDTAGKSRGTCFQVPHTHVEGHVVLVTRFF